MIEEVPYNEILRIRKEVMYPNKDIDFVKLPDDEQGIHMGYYVNGIAVSIISLFLKENKLQFRKFATLPEVQGNGYGTKLLEYIIDYAENMNFDSIWCNSRTGKLDFYKKYDFKESGKVFEKNGYSFIVIEKDLPNS